MATTTSTRSVANKQFVSPVAVPLVLGLLCLAGGILLAVNAVQSFWILGADAPYLTQVMALNAPLGGETSELLGPAGGSIDNLLFVVALVGSAVAAILLVVASWFWLSAARTRHPEATRRVTAVGLWMALILAVLAILPIQGAWQEAGVGGSGAVWGGATVQLVALTCLGLLLLQFSAPRLRASLGAFRS